MPVTIDGSNTPTAGGVGYGDGNELAFTGAGSSGQVLTSNGASAPTWAAVSSAPGVDVQTFTSSGTWTKPAGYGTTSRVLIEVWGGGGSGSVGGCCCATFYGQGAGGGAYNYRWIALGCLSATESVTIGAGGAARSTTLTVGASGGTTSVGTKAYAYGGGGGSSSTGGGGGGQLSVGGTVTPGGPGFVGSLSEGYGFAGGQQPVAGFMKGGGGGGAGGGSGISGAGSVFGGGGGGGAGTSTAGPGGTSQYGGNGGAGSVSSTATAGSQPSGGGGGSRTGTSGAGGAGQARVTVFYGA